VPGERTPALRGATARGFTLIEILVVLVIIAVMTGAALYRITVTGIDRGLDLEGDRLCDVLQAATQQSGLEGRDLGLRFLPDHYEVLAYSGFTNTWGPVPEDRTYASHGLPDGVHLALELEGKRVLLKVPEDQDPVVPQVIVSAAGDTSTYRVSFTREGTDHEFRVEGVSDGTLKVTRPGSSP
jgi:general secretion pathway protein H